MKLKLGLHIFLLLLTVQLVWLQLLNCDYIKEVEIYVQKSSFYSSENNYKKNVSGCIDNTKFPTENIYNIFIECANTKITKLGEQSIKNMKLLKSVAVNNCPINAIEPHAFFNVSLLKFVAVKNGSLNKIPKGVFEGTPELAKVSLYGNQIDYIEDFAFSNLPELLTVDLSFNQLRYISSNWFFNSTDINLLNLSHNLLTKIHADRFRCLLKLRFLYLSHNHISVIEPYAFRNLPNLILLELNNNHLTTLTPDIFSKELNKFPSIDVQENLINFISDAFFEDIIRKWTHFGILTITGNPVICPCLDRIHRWMFLYPFLDIKWKYTRDSPNCQRRLLPVCVADKKSPKSCRESVSEEATKKYLKTIRSICP